MIEPLFDKTSSIRFILLLLGMFACGCFAICLCAYGGEQAKPAGAKTNAAVPASDDNPPMKPNLKFPDLAAYEKEIAEPGELLQNEHLLLFAPKRKKKEADIIFRYLSNAYDELLKIVGEHTKYKIVVYHLPKGWGGTGECVIEYDYGNLDFEKSDEWKKHHVPHVSGYIEEMAHNFVSATKAQFGWEMIGWSLGVKVTQKVADNPIFNRQVKETRNQQAQTYARYKALGYTFPQDIEANLCDRIHAYLLWQCEQAYGARFWQDFFALVRGRRADLDAAVHKAGDDAIRNERYRITVECFDSLPRLNFKKRLSDSKISALVDAKSLHPTDPGWNRKFMP
jgi:hypothetical protein